MKADGCYCEQFWTSASSLFQMTVARLLIRKKSWRRSNGDPATIDDITVVVIPILPYKHEVCNTGEVVEDAEVTNGEAPESPEEELEVTFEDKAEAGGAGNLDLVTGRGE